jgi:branched-subunit amino acid aminotransferase/4-amino-4-deoxychorismate lyase
MFVTSSLSGVVPVSQIGDVPADGWSGHPGRITMRIRDAREEFVAGTAREPDFRR